MSCVKEEEKKNHIYLLCRELHCAGVLMRVYERSENNGKDTIAQSHNAAVLGTKARVK